MIKLLYKILLAPILRIILGILIVPWFIFTLAVMLTSFVIFNTISVIYWIFSGQTLGDIMCWDFDDDLTTLAVHWLNSYLDLFSKIQEYGK